MLETAINNINWFIDITSQHFNNQIDNNIDIKFKSGLKVMSFNIRRDNLNDGNNNWKYRKEAIVKMIADVAPDIICMQEVMPHMAKYLNKKLSKYYDAIGLECFTGRELTKSWCIFGEGLLTLYRKDRFLIKNSDKIRLYDGRFINVRRAHRICLYDWKDRQSIDVYNTHLCHKSKDAREDSLNKLHKIWAMSYTNNQFICGDFNCQLKDEISWIDRYADIFTHNLPDAEGTINYFSGPSGKTIDFIFSSAGIKETSIIRKEYGGCKFLSDHWPVVNTY